VQERAELLESRAYELYLTDRIEEAIAAREEAVRLREEVGDRVAVGAGHRWISRLAWVAGRRSLAERHAALAVELLEEAGDPRELGFAYSNRSHLAMLARDDAAAVTWGERALRLAEELGDVRPRLPRQTYLRAHEHQEAVGVGARRPDRYRPDPRPPDRNPDFTPPRVANPP